MRNALFRVLCPADGFCDFLCLIPNLVAHDRLVGIFFDDPFFLRPPIGAVVFIGNRGTPVLHRTAFVRRIGKHIPNGFMAPPRLYLPIDFAAVFLRPVQRRIRNTLVCERPCNAVGRGSFDSHLKDSPDDFRRRLVNDRRAVIIAADKIPRKGSSPKCICLLSDLLPIPREFSSRYLPNAIR